MGEYVLPKVKAKFKYARQNEDELQFEKGAIIQLITKDDGGWYEGKYNGQIGWFPSNYVREIKPKKTVGKEPEKPTKSESGQSAEEQQKFHQQVVLDFVITELNHTKEMQNLITSCLTPLKQNNVLTNYNYQMLIGNLENISEFQTKFINEIEECSRLPEAQQQIGQLFEKEAETFERLFTTYCDNHHNAVRVILENKDSISRHLENMESPSTVGFLTIGLSKPFRRLDHYPSVLREVERHINDSHADRLLVSKAICSYEKISFICQELRKRKESEEHVLSSTITGWEGESISNLGKLIYSSITVCMTGNDEKTSRYLLLFPSVLLMLSTSSRMSAFKYEGKIHISALHVKKLDDSQYYQHAFEIKGHMLENIVVVTNSAEEQRMWVKSLQLQCDTQGSRQQQQQQPPQTPTSSVNPSRIVSKVPVTQIPPPPMHASPPNLTTPVSPSNTMLQNKPPYFRSGLSPPVKENCTFIEINCGSSREKKTWSKWCLRPSALIKHASFSNGTKDYSTIERSRSPKPSTSSRKKKKKLEKKPTDNEEVIHHNEKLEKARAEEEREMLVVLDIYNGAHTRGYLNNSRNASRNPHCSILDEKLIVEDPEGNDTRIAEKSLIDTVYEMKDQMSQLQQDVKKLAKQAEDERHQRLHMEGIIRRAATGTTKKPARSLSRKFTY